MENIQSEILRKDEAKKIAEELEEKQKQWTVEEIIKNNEIVFDYNNLKYKIRKLTLKDRDTLDLLRRKKINQLMQEKDEKGNFVYLMETDLRKIYKERGIDIDQIEKEITDLQTKEVDLRKSLGEALVNKAGENVCNTYKEQIEDLMKEQRILQIQKLTLLENSLENLMVDYVDRAIVYLSFDKEVEGKWVRAFNTFEEYEESEDEDLRLKATFYSMTIERR